MSISTSVGDVAKFAESVRPIRQPAGTVNGVSFDRSASGGPTFHSAVMVAQTGAVQGGPSAQTLDVKLQDSADDSSWADASNPVTGQAIVLPQITAADTLKQSKVSLKGLRRYVRLVATVGFTGGSTPTMDIVAGLIVGGSNIEPVL